MISPSILWTVMQSALPVVHWIGGGIIVVLVFFAAATEDAERQARSAPAPDSTGAQIDLEREGEGLSVRALFTGDASSADTLSYELTVRRCRAAGTTQTAQSGTFAVTPGRADTLSTVQVNVQSGDQLRLRLVVRADRQPVDTARIERTVS